jgi:hypothetical protein
MAVVVMVLPTKSVMAAAAVYFGVLEPVPGVTVPPVWFPIVMVSVCAVGSQVSIDEANVDVALE